MKELMSVLNAFWQTSPVFWFALKWGMCGVVIVTATVTLPMLCFKAGRERVKVVSLFVFGVCAACTLMLSLALWARYESGHEFVNGVPEATFHVLNVEKTSDGKAFSVQMRRSDGKIATLTMVTEDGEKLLQLASKGDATVPDILGIQHMAKQ